MDNIEFYENQLIGEELCYLQESVGFGRPNLLQANKAISNSLYCVSVKVNGEIAGMGRVIGDGARIFYLQDVFINPKFQRRGIGQAIVKRLLSFVKGNALPNTTTKVGLMAAKGKEEFYLKQGFRVRPNENEGNGMMLNIIKE